MSGELVASLLLFAGAPAGLVFFIVWPLVDALQAPGPDETPHPTVQRGPVRGQDGRMRLYRRPAWYEGWLWTESQADERARTLADEFVESPDEPKEQQPPHSHPYR